MYERFSWTFETFVHRKLADIVLIRWDCSKSYRAIQRSKSRLPRRCLRSSWNPGPTLPHKPASFLHRTTLSFFRNTFARRHNHDIGIESKQWFYQKNLRYQIRCRNSISLVLSILALVILLRLTLQSSSLHQYAKTCLSTGPSTISLSNSVQHHSNFAAKHSHLDGCHYGLRVSNFTHFSS